MFFQIDKNLSQKFQGIENPSKWINFEETIYFFNICNDKIQLFSSEFLHNTATKSFPNFLNFKNSPHEILVKKDKYSPLAEQSIKWIIALSCYW